MKIVMGADQYPGYINGAATFTARPAAGLAEVVSCGIDLDRSTASRPLIAAQAPTLLLVGRLEQEKHVDELLHAFAHLPRALRARLEIVGMGSLRPALEALACALGLGESVRFLGALDDAELLLAYGRADVFVMPVTAELQSIATLAAMATALPVVAADAMALPHLVRHGADGRLYVPGELDGIAVASPGVGLPEHELAMAS